MMKFLNKKVKLKLYEYVLPFCMLALITCADNTALNRHHSYIIDTTDEIIIPDSLKLLEGFKLAENVYTGAHLRIRVIQSIKKGAIHELELLRQNAYMENKVSRINEIQDFYRKAGILLHKLDHQDEGENYSFVRDLIVDELQLLGNLYAGDIQLHVYSDLREHTPNPGDLNFYNPQVIQQLMDDPNNIKLEYFKGVQLPNLGAVQVFFYYESESWEDIILFEAIAGMWQKQLEEAGATCTIISKLNMGGDQ